MVYDLKFLLSHNPFFPYMDKSKYGLNDVMTQYNHTFYNLDIQKYELQSNHSRLEDAKHNICTLEKDLERKTDLKLTNQKIKDNLVKILLHVGLLIFKERI